MLKSAEFFSVFLMFCKDFVKNEMCFTFHKNQIDYTYFLWYKVLCDICFGYRGEDYYACIDCVFTNPGNACSDDGF